LFPKPYSSAILKLQLGLSSSSADKDDSINTQVLYSLPFFVSNASQFHEHTPCTLLRPPPIHGAMILNSTAIALHSMTEFQYENGVDVYSFETFLTHGDAQEAVRITVWLPQEPTTPWNGRFQGTGGGGFILACHG
jgi:hypothetical protein